jgi:hypothetical protein
LAFGFDGALQREPFKKERFEQKNTTCVIGLNLGRNFATKVKKFFAGAESLTQGFKPG